jgi:hypothetical protein
MKNFLLYSTLFSIFTESIYFSAGFDVKFFYLVVLINFFVLLLHNKIVYSKGLSIFHGIIIFTGIGSCVLGYNKFGYYAIQLFFITLISTYYFSYFSFFKDRYKEIIFTYCKFSLILAILGFLKWPYDIAVGKAFHSIMIEPAHYCTIILPAFFITLKDRTYPRYYYITIFLSILVSGSSLGIMGLGMSLLFYSKKISLRKIILSSSVVVFLGTIVYIVMPSFKMRFDDTLNSSTTGDLSNANLSSYALLSNFFVSVESFKSNPIFGNGIGSHMISRKLYLGDIEGIEVFEQMGSENLNAQDAGSLFSRLMSEMGLIGVIGAFYFILRYYVRVNDELSFYSVVSRAIILYFFAKLFREGHYFSPEMYFFIFAYYFSYL